MILIGVTPTMTENGVNQIVQVNRDYMDGILRAGAMPVLLPLPEEKDAAGVIDALFDRLDGILFTGGGDLQPGLYGQENTFSGKPEPERDVMELPLMQRCIAEKKPFFAICRGVQVMNVAQGGTLVQDLTNEMPGTMPHQRIDIPKSPAHSVMIEKNTLLSDILGTDTIMVNSRHHQAAGVLGKDLILCAKAEDGVTEGLWLPEHPFALGVQWHPESLAMKDEMAQKLFDAFVKACERAKTGENQA